MEWLEIYANLKGKYRGRIWFDVEKHTRFMELENHLFVWNPKQEMWRLV